MLNSSGQLTPADPAVKKQFATFKDEVTREATQILSERMPQKILYFNKLVSEKPLADGASTTADGASTTADDALPARDNPWLKFVPHDVPMLANGSVCETVDEVSEDASSAMPLRGGVKRAKVISASGKEKVIHLTPYPAHPQIYRMTEEIKKEVAELVEMAGCVKLFIQLNVPRIEGGNNFGVQIQEEAIQELGRVEDAAFTVCSAIVEYFTTRATLATKIIKYPNVHDFKEALRELDEKKWMLLKVTRIDMRNNYAMLYDLLSKNWERVVKPRQSEGNSMIY